MLDGQGYDSRTALVLDASGAVGSAIASALADRGWNVRGLSRDPAAADLAWRGNPSPVSWVAGEVLDRGDLVVAARGVQLIVHALDLPASRDQVGTLQMIDNTIVAARLAGGARILLPATIHNFDPAATPVVREDSLQQPRSRRGDLQVEIESRLWDAREDVPSLIMRSGDLFGPDLHTGWFTQAMVRPGQPVRHITNPDHGVGHSWTYLPDFAEAAARLLDAPEQLRPFEQVGFEGTWDPDGTVMPNAIRAAAGSEGIPERSFPWWLMRLRAPFGGFPREAIESAASWRHPVRLDNRRLVGLLGREPRTPLAQAVRSTLASLGCLPVATMTLQECLALASSSGPRHPD